jgi:hypothetical protein
VRWRDAIQGAVCAAWSFPESDRQRRSAPASAARMFKQLFLGYQVLYSSIIEENTHA